MKEVNKSKKKNKDVLNNIPNKKSSKKSLIFVNFSLAFLFTNIFLFLSSFWFNYTKFQNEIIFISILLIASIFIKKVLPLITTILAIAFYIYFVYINFNYGFVLASSLILGILVLHFIKPNLKIPHFVYSLLPLFILGHIIWFNILPLGFEGEWRLDFGAEDDTSDINSLYIIDNRNVLSPPQSYGENKWRSFEKDGSIEIGLNTEVSLDNKTVELIMDYDATGPIYVNGKLFYDPAWGSSVNLGEFGDEFLYGANYFNLTIPYENIELEEFLRITNTTSIEDYIFKIHKTNLVDNKGEYKGLNDLWQEREDLKDETNLKLLIQSNYLNISNMNNINLDNFSTVNELLMELNLNNIESLLKLPLNKFLDSKSKTLQQFMDSELNIGPYPKLRPKNNDYNTVEEYIRGNFPNGVSMIDFSGKYGNLEKEMNEKYFDSINSISYYKTYSNEMKQIPIDFRGPISLYGVFGDKIQVKLNKRDMNLYNGSDDVTMKIYDVLDNEIDSWTFSDSDGIVTRTTVSSDWKEFEFDLDLEEGIYRLEFDHTYDSQHPDFILGNITFNTNIIEINDRFLLWSKGTFYNINPINSLLVRYWWNGYDQLIKFDDGTNKYLNELDRGSWVNVDVNSKNQIEFEKGFLWVIPDENLAVWEGTNIDSEFEKSLQITKAIELKNSNIDLVEISGLNITATEGTKISDINIIIK